MDKNKINVPKIRFPGFEGPWEQRKLGDVTQTITKGTTPIDKNWIGPVNYIKTESIDNESGNLTRTSSTSLEEHEGFLKRSQLMTNDILFSIVGTLGRVGLVQRKDLPANTNQQIAIIRLKESNPYFVMNALKSPSTESFISCEATIGAQPSLSLWQINKLEINVPSIIEQEKIGNFFLDIDNLITLHQRKLEHLQDKKKVLLQKMFPKEGEKFPELRFPGFTDPWEQRKFEELSSSFEYGLNAAAKEFDGKNKYIRITDIDDETRLFSTSDYTSPDTNLSNAESYILKKGDIVFARTGASVGKSYIYRDSDGLVYYAGFLIRARIKPEYDADFIFQNTLTKRYEKFINVISQRSGQPGVNAQEYATYEISLPKFDEQVKISIFFNELDNIITLHKRKLEHLQQQKKGLLQQMFI